MTLQTCAELLSFLRELENQGAKFYQDLSQKYAKDKDILLSFAKENEKNIEAVERAYYGVISDAIEGCFAFNINPDEYRINTQLGEKASYPGALDQAIKIEEKLIKFYSDAAAQSKSLMADLPRALTMVAKKRNNRLPKIKSLLGPVS